MPSKAATVAEYLASLPPDRREAISAVRRVILDNLDKDYAEGMQYGMIGFAVPHSVFPAGYHCDPRQPLPFAGLASQKGHMSLHLMALYMDAEQDRWFRAAWAKTGKRLDMGKACIRFKKADDLALDVIGEAVRRIPAAAYIANYQRLLAKGRNGGGSAKPAARKTVARATGTRKSAARVSAPAKKRTSGRAAARRRRA